MRECGRGAKTVGLLSFHVNEPLSGEESPPNSDAMGRVGLGLNNEGARLEVWVYDVWVSMVAGRRKMEDRLGLGERVVAETEVVLEGLRE